MQRLNMNRVAARLSSIQRVTATLNDYSVCEGNAAAKVVLSFNTKPNSDEVHTVIANLFNKSVSVVRNSFRRINAEREHATVMVGFVVPNTLMEPYNERAGSRFQIMSANILMDKTDETLWAIRETDAGRMLCRQGADDLTELLETARVRRVGVPQMASVVASATSIAAPGEYAAYVDPASASVRFGYVLSTHGDSLDIVTSHADHSVVTVATPLVVEVAALDGVPQRKEQAAPVADGKNMSEYYKKVYDYDPQYFQKLEEIINQHAAA